MEDFKYKVCIITDAGRVRENNEDNFYCNGLYKSDKDEMSCFYNLEYFDNILLAVFDGMGGNLYGEEASLTGVKTLAEYIEDNNIESEHQSFFNIIEIMNKRICEKGKELGAEIGSTVVMLYVFGGEIKVINVGDSRAYLYRSRELKQLTTDHTEANSFMELQKKLGISYEMPQKSMKNSLTQHLGIYEDEFILEPSITDKISVKKNDIYLLCSDGLTGMISDEKILDILSQDTPLEAKCNMLKLEAVFAGGNDNITLILLEAN